MRLHASNTARSALPNRGMDHQISGGSKNIVFKKFGLTTVTTISTTAGVLLSQIPLPVLAASDYEVAELPPVWIPVVIGIALLGGVGLLTSSLGDVYDEESRLGMQSGARAKKEIDRSRSSYFKKK